MPDLKKIKPHPDGKVLTAQELEALMRQAKLNVRKALIERIYGKKKP